MDYNKYINYLMIVLAFIFPLSMGGANIVLGSMLLLWILEKNFNSKIDVLKNDKLFLSLVGIIISILISTLLSKSYDQGFLINSGLKNEFDFIFRHLIWISLLYVVFITSIKKEYLNKIIIAFLMSMFINELISYGVFFHLIDINYLKKLGLLYKNITYYDPSPMHHSFYSMYLAITILILLDRVFNGKDNFYFKIIESLFLISATINLFMNGGRTGQLAIIIGLIIYFIIYFKNRIKYILLSFLILIGVIFSAYKISPIFQKRMNQSKNSLELVIKKQDYSSSWGERIGMNIVGVSYIFDNLNNFIFGGFAGEAKKNYLKYGEIHYKNIFPYFKDKIHLHNQFLQIWMDGGIFAFILLIYLFYSLIKMETNIEALKLGIIFIFLFSFISDVMMYRVQTLILFIFIIAILKKEQKVE